MNLVINWEDSHKVRKLAVVVVKRNPKGRIIYNSGLNYFYHTSAADNFKKVIGKDPSLSLHMVDILVAHAPPADGVDSGYWCPYCQTRDYWVAGVGNYKKCPICGISDEDFYVKNYNQTWETGMKSKSTKKKVDRVNDRIRKKKRGKVHNVND